ncbi:hypothetical protein [Streptomyces lavendulocolor]|uniref:hypothetical protein n=1 Tax=Streptomyces lavendulocolor TaxID=67316 RepID=UPI003C2C0D98
MLRLIRTATLAALRSDLDAARRDRDDARTDAATANDSAIRAEDVAQTQLRQLAQAHADRLRAEREAARAEGELTALRAQSLLDTEDRAALRALLRTARKARADRVYVLFRLGELHSIHASHDAAEAAAEEQGAPRDGWTTLPPGAALPPAHQVPWRVQSLPLHVD